jgi:hypothetical protein
VDVHGERLDGDPRRGRPAAPAGVAVAGEQERSAAQRQERAASTDEGQALAPLARTAGASGGLGCTSRHSAMDDGPRLGHARKAPPSLACRAPSEDTRASIARRLPWPDVTGGSLVWKLLRHKAHLLFSWLARPWCVTREVARFNDPAAVRS